MESEEKPITINAINAIIGNDRMGDVNMNASVTQDVETLRKENVILREKIAEKNILLKLLTKRLYDRNRPIQRKE